MVAPSTSSDLWPYRLHNQLLSKKKLRSPEDVVSWFGAVQAQDYAGAKWALGLRMRKASDESIERAFNEGKILRTHVMRPTWHFVAPADIRWVCELTAPRVKAANRYMLRQLKLDHAVFSKSNKVISKALEGKLDLTRAELAQVLNDAGIKAEGLRLVYVIMNAELDALICSGPRRGKQFTYSLIEERCPESKNFGRVETLENLAKRYFASHGPATLSDFVWWSGLTTKDAEVGLSDAGSHFSPKELGGKTYWFPRQARTNERGVDAALLLPTFDEFFVGYRSFDKSRRGEHPYTMPTFSSPVVSKGKVLGSWRREFKKGEVDIEIVTFGKLSGEEEEELSRSAQKYGEFMGVPVKCAIKSVR
ncbi:MAG: winged helix DNA-binding domain-containing protein [Thaumarchaeota archaeon]|nr:winged helix DNA-binding domain-containing protein [Nitrososphaerota archaeon]